MATASQLGAGTIDCHKHNKYDGNDHQVRIVLKRKTLLFITIFMRHPCRLNSIRDQIESLTYQHQYRMSPSLT